MRQVNRTLRLLVALVLGFTLVACEKRLTKANVDQVTEGMAKKQVESILGLPTTSETIDFKVMKRTVYVYKQPNGTVTITFRDDKVESKESTIVD